MSCLIQYSAVLLMICSAFGTGPAEPPSDTDATVRALIAKFNDVDANVRRAAANDAAKLGASAVPALIDVIKAEKRKEVRRYAIDALADIGTSSVPSLLELLGNPTDDVQLCALQMIAKIGPDAREAVPSVVRTLRSPNERIRQFAMKTLGGIGPGAGPAVPAILDALAADPSCHENAVIAFGEIGPNAAEAVPMLAEDARRGHERAITALGQIGPAAAPAVPALIACLKANPRSSTSRGIPWTVGKIGKAAVPQLVEAYADPDLDVRRIVIESIGSVGSDAKGAMAVLALALHDDYRYVGVHAAKALSRMGPESVSVMEGAREWFEKLGDSRRVKALEDALEDATYGEGNLRAESRSPSEISDGDSRLRGLSLSDLPAPPIVPVAAETMKRVPSGFSLAKKEIPSDWEGFLHYEYSLHAKESGDTIFLGRFREDISSSTYKEDVGFSEGTLNFTWLEQSRFVHVSWGTCPMGQGTNTTQTHLLLAKHEGHWKQVFRDTQDAYARHWTLKYYEFKYDTASAILTVLEDDCSNAIKEEYKEIDENKSDKDANAVLSSHEVTLLTEWRFKLETGRLEYVGGKKYFDLDERDVLAGHTEEDERTIHAYDIHEVAKLLTPESPEATVEMLRELNPGMKSSDMCWGLVLFDANVKWRGADEKHYYMMDG
jgi:HEAT repeat protein